MDSLAIRKTFVDFFVEREHVARPSSSMIPVDPTLLLTNAGMVQFKPYFLGEEVPPFRRAVTIQKCARTIDIDIIGTTTRHFSFFEMMGNFSFGDYFKERAIPWSYELVTEGFGIDPDRLWFTVYETDDEAAEIWKESVGAPPERVQRGGKDNFWQMGVAGPCGPCSEIFVDRGPAYGETGGPMGGGEERYVEIWNLVFMQNIQDVPYHVIGDLPAKSIDTGSGLERMAMVLGDLPSVFDVDTVKPIKDAASAFTGVVYGSDPISDVSLRILADHGRTVSVLIADGVIPSNEGRGYVLRRLLRRAIRHAFTLGGEGLVMPRLVGATVEALGGAYPELVARSDFVIDVASREEHNFRRTLASGLDLLEAELAGLAPSAPVEGSVAFKLHDTYGFPIELTEEVAAERRFRIDRDGFDKAMSQQRERARRAWKGGDAAAAADLYRGVLDEVGLTDFLGYETEAGRGQVLAILREGEQVPSAEAGQEVELFLDRTPFYGESGGQVGDVGVITTDTGTMQVKDTQHSLPGLHGHRVKVTEGSVMVGQDAETMVDGARRTAIRKSHTGTHMLHWALRQVVGDHVHQAGSLVEAGRLRFDISHFAAVAESELVEVEDLANRVLIHNERVTTTVTSREHANDLGALAFFGDKYGDEVRVVQIGGFSIELCGGTHVHATGEVGPIVVVSESSIGSNMRRLEALTGTESLAYLGSARRRLAESSRLLRSTPDQVPERIAALHRRIEEVEQKMTSMEGQRRSEEAVDLAAGAVTSSGRRLVVAERSDLNPEQLRALVIGVRDRIGSGIVVLGSCTSGKGSLVGAVTADLVEGGVSAGDLVAAGAKVLGGGASRDPALSQAGGPQGELLEDALDAIRQLAEKALGGG